MARDDDPMVERTGRPSNEHARSRIEATLEQVAREERDAARVRARVEELKESHWVTHVCPRGHVIEVHRDTGGREQIARCPICGAESVLEVPEHTARREHLDWSSAANVLARAFDMLSEWAHDRLNASSWTERSDLQRQSKLKDNRYQNADDDRNQDPQQFANPFIPKRDRAIRRYGR